MELTAFDLIKKLADTINPDSSVMVNTGDRLVDIDSVVVYRQKDGGPPLVVVYLKDDSVT